MDHRPQCVQGFGCHCPMDRTPTPAAVVSTLPRWLALIVWLLRWP